MSDRKMVIIDDEEDLCRNLKDFFEAADFDVSVAYTAMDGIKVVEKVQPDIILLDVDLPDESGLNLTGLGQMFNVIIISGKVAVPDEIVRKVMHAYCFMKKPFEVSDVLEKIEFILDKKNVLNKEVILKHLFKNETLSMLYKNIRQNTGIFFSPKDLVDAIENKILDEESKQIAKSVEKELPRYDKVEGLPIGAYKEWYREHGKFEDFFEQK